MIFIFQELNVSRDTLEIGAQYSVAKQDTQAFQRYMAQLQSYYYDYAGIRQIGLRFFLVASTQEKKVYPQIKDFECYL